MKRLILFLFCVPFLTSCAVRVFTGRAPVEYNKAQIEDIVFTDNDVNARVKWEKESITPYFRFPKKVYFLGSNTAILPDGRLYYHDQQNLFSLDITTGEVISKYEKPSGTEPQVVDMEKAAIEGEKKVFPLVNFMGKGRDFFVVNEKTGQSEIKYDGIFNGERFHNRNKVITVLDDLFNHIISAYQFGIKKPDLWVRKYFIDLHAVKVFDNRLIILYSKKENLCIESYDLNTGKLIWQNQFDAIKPPDKSLNELIHADELKALQKLNELSIVETLKMDKETGEFIQRVISLSPESGKLNWQMSDVTRVFTKRTDNNDNLFYLSKKGQPDVIYGIDQKTGEEKLKLTLADYQHIQGIISSSDRIFFPIQKDFKEHPAQYGGFAAVSKDTGKIEWTITLNEQLNSLPIYKDGILYFGQGPDSYKNLVAGSRKEYEYNLYSLSKEEMPDALHKTAFAVDAKTGKMLWKINLEGGDESYIEKIMVKDNMAFIKSVSGWLYAIEFERPAIAIN